MSASKYANLPDIDTAPDIYETEDIFPSEDANKGASSDDETPVPPRSAIKNKNGDFPGDGVDSTSVLNTEQATRRFRNAERRHERARSHYTYPPSPTTPTSPPGSPHARPIPLSQRLRNLQNELASLENELADPSNPQLNKEREEHSVDPGELIRGVVDVRSRLDKIRRDKEGRGRLVGVILGDEGQKAEELSAPPAAKEIPNAKPVAQNLVDMDRRVSELEKLVGSSTTTLDELSPLPPPLLPQISRLNAQMMLLTQPRHIDSISRRLKLLLSDLDRASSSQLTHRRNSSQPTQQKEQQHAQIQEQILPLLSRLGPLLPQIPHILTRLRTLSSLHTAAGEFQSTLGGLEEEQKKIQEALDELNEAVTGVEVSLEANRGVVRGNVEGLEKRVEKLFRRLDELDRGS